MFLISEPSTIANMPQPRSLHHHQALPSIVPTSGILIAKGIVDKLGRHETQGFLHYYEIAKYSSMPTGLLKISNSSEIDHI